MRDRSGDRRPSSSLYNKDAVGRVVAAVEGRGVRVIDIRNVNVGWLIAYLNGHTTLHCHGTPRDHLHAFAAERNITDKGHRAVRSSRVELEEGIRIDAAATNGQRPAGTQCSDLDGIGRDLGSSEIRSEEHTSE